MVERLRTEIGSIAETRITLRQIDRLLQLTEQLIAAHQRETANPHSVTIDQAIEAAEIPGGGVATSISDQDLLLYNRIAKLWENKAWSETPVLGEHHVTLLAESEIEALVLKYITTTTDLILTSSHTMVYCDALSRPIVLTLPAASSNGGKLYAAVKVDSSGNTVTIANGSFSAVLTVQDEAVPVSSDGTDWRVAF